MMCRLNYKTAPPLLFDLNLQLIGFEKKYDKSRHGKNLLYKTAQILEETPLQNSMKLHVLVQMDYFH